MRLANTEEYKLDPKTATLYNDLVHYWYASEYATRRTRVLYKYSKRQEENNSGRKYPWTQSRFHPGRHKMVGLQIFPQWVRAALAADYDFDVDIVNAHPGMLFSVLKSVNSKKFDHLEYYCKNQDKILEHVSHFLGMDQFMESKRPKSLPSNS